LPNVIVHGALKSAFLAQLVTDWMGAQGSLKRLSVQYRGMDVAGQPMYCNGVVTSKRVENGEHLVECDIWTENSSGEKTTRGSALVSLPGSP
jgi:acyl dehydratase